LGTNPTSGKELLHAFGVEVPRSLGSMLSKHYGTIYSVCWG